MRTGGRFTQRRGGRNIRSSRVSLNPPLCVILRPMSVNTSFPRLKVKAVQQETAECISIVFDIPDTLRPLFLYRPGQYLTLKTDIRGEEVRRSYSICSAPGDEALSVA